MSMCGCYRYQLRRSWDELWGSGTGTVNFIMLNPSTADATRDDPTIRRCVGFARSWGYCALAVTNLYAFRATNPRELTFVADPVGPENDAHIDAVALASHLVVCAWGARGGKRGSIIRDRLSSLGIKPKVIRVTKNGDPQHPLYLPADLVPFPF